jgi:ribosomal-protein-alanine N-acetyltransferase
MIEFRNGRPEDASFVVSLVGRAPSAAQWSTAQIKEILKEETDSLVLHRLLVVEEEGMARGFIAGRMLPPECEIENVVVEASRKGYGFGSLLLKEFLEQARAAGCDRAFLEVRESNRAARRLYEKWGFRVTGRRARYYENPQEDAVLYACALS